MKNKSIRLSLVKTQDVEIRNSPENIVNTQIYFSVEEANKRVTHILVSDGSVQILFIRLNVTGENYWMAFVRNRSWFVPNLKVRLYSHREFKEFEVFIFIYNLFGKNRFHREIDALNIARNIAYFITSIEFNKDEILDYTKIIIRGYKDSKGKKLIA